MKTKIQFVDNYSTLTEKKERKTKPKVDLVSSHSDNERENGPFVAYTLEGSAVSDFYNNDRIFSYMHYVPKDGEQLVYEEI